MTETELDIACERLKRALTPYAIQRKLEREREYTLYINLAWEGKTLPKTRKSRKLA